MLWLLIRRPAFRLPTALQVHKDYAILFHEGGISKFTNLDDPRFIAALTLPFDDDPESIGGPSRWI